MGTTKRPNGRRADEEQKAGDLLVPLPKDRLKVQVRYALERIWSRLFRHHLDQIWVQTKAMRDLLHRSASMPIQALLAQLTRRLRDNAALAEDAARWAVESWAVW